MKKNLAEEQKRMLERQLATKTSGSVDEVRQTAQAYVEAEPDDMHEELTGMSPKQIVEDGRPLCSICHRRFCRKGKTFCSRCTITGQIEQLRDKLPTTALPAVIIEPVMNVEASVGIPNGKYTIVDSPLPVTCAVPGFEDIAIHQGNTDVNVKPLFSRKQVCSALNVAAATLSRWEKKGYVPQPARLAHNGQCVYTQELIDKIKEYMSKSYVPQISSSPTSDNPRVFRPAVKGKFSLGKKVEKSVASRLGNIGGRGAKLL